MANRFEQFSTAPQQPPFMQNRFSRYAQPSQGIISGFVERGQRRRDALSRQLGDQYDPEQRFQGDFLAEMDIARSAAPEDRLAKFQRSFPEGELKTVQTAEGPVEVARGGADDPYRELRMAPHIAGIVASEPMVGGLVGTMGGPAGTALGTGAGVLAQQQIEQHRGYGQGEGGFGRALTEGGVAGVVDAATRGVSRIFRGGPMPQAQRESLIRGIEASKLLELQPLTVGQTSPSPFLRGMFRQVGVTSPKIEQTIARQEQSLLDTFRRRIEAGGAHGVSDAELQKIIQAQTRELQNIISPKTLTRTDAGEALQKGLETYKQASRVSVDRLYERALSLTDDVAFDLSPAQAVADDILRGVRGMGRTGKPVPLAETPEGALASVVQDVRRLNPRVDRFASAGGEWDAFTQVKTLRTRLFDLKESSDGGVRREATRLWNELTEVMNNPVSGDPDFVAAYRRASVANAIREENLGKTYVARALRTDTPEVLARKYLKPGHTTELSVIRDLIPRAQWDDFRQTFQADIMRAPNPAQGLRDLARFEATDPQGLRMILTVPEENALKSYLSAKTRFEASPAARILEKNLTDGERMVQMVRGGTAQDVADTVRMAGGRNSPTAQSMKAGVYKDILDNSMDVSTAGVDVLDANKLIKNIQQWRASGKLDHLMSPDDWRALESIQSYAAPLAETADIGGGMMGGALRQQAVHAPTETVMGEGKKVVKRLLRPLYSNAVTARILTIPAAKGRLVRGGQRRVIPAQEAATALTIMEYELRRTADRSLLDAGSDAANTLGQHFTP
jgi:hypothetical protein